MLHTLTKIPQGAPNLTTQDQIKWNEVTEAVQVQGTHEWQPVAEEFCRLNALVYSG